MHDLLQDSSEDAVRAATRKLNRGSAMDALGWSHEAWTSVRNLPHGRQLLSELLLQYCTSGLGHEGEDLMNASLIIPLYKDARGSAIRPIAAPSVHRKVLAKVRVSVFRAELQHGAGEAQHAAMSSNGTLRVAQKVSRKSLRRAKNVSNFLGVAPGFLLCDSLYKFEVQMLMQQ